MANSPPYALRSRGPPPDPFANFSFSYEAKLHGDLRDAFDTISTPGIFAAWKALRETPPAGLHVDGVGDIQLPLSKQQAQQLIEKAQQAAVSIGEQKKLVDLPVPNTWEFNADQLTFFEPAWQGYLLDLGKRAARKLGIQAPIRLELFKMVIYAKGAMTEPQTETERTRGMFGTLIISLPSAHKGGEVVVRHNGEAITLLTEEQSFACWYSDATHELLPVKSGYRCVLIYNLAVAPGATRPTAHALDLKKVPLRETLEYWLRDLATNNATDVPGHFYHRLENEYTEFPISLDMLESEDLKLLEELQGLTRELHFDIFLAQLEKEVYGTVPEKLRDPYDDLDFDLGPHEIVRVIDTSYTVKSLCALDGTNISSNYTFKMDHYVDDHFDDEEEGITSRDYDGEGHGTHYYLRSAFVVVAHERLGEYIAQAIVESTKHNSTFRSRTSNNCDSAMRYLERVFPASSAQAPMPDAILLSESRKSQQITEIMKKSFKSSHFPLFQTVGARHEGHLQISFFDWAKQWLDKRPDADRADKYKRWIPSLIQGYPSVTQRIDVIRKMSNTTGHAAALNESLRNWAQGSIRQCLMSFPGTTEKPTVHDGESIVSVLFDLNEAWVDISSLLQAIFGRLPQIDATAFLLAVLARLKERAVASGVPMSYIAEFYRRLNRRVFNGEKKLSDIITTTKIKCPSQTGQVVTPEALVLFCCDLQDISPNTASFLHPFIEHISAQCHTFSTEDMRHLWVPFLHQLIPALVSRSVPLNTSPYQQLARQMLIRLENRTIGPYPLTADLPIPQVRCECDECKSFNQFLRDVARGIGRFSLTQDKAQHLKTQLNQDRIPCLRYTRKSTSTSILVIIKYHYSHQEITRWIRWKNELYSTLVSKIPSAHLQSLLGPQEAARVQSSVELEKHLSRLSKKFRGPLPGY